MTTLGIVHNGAIVHFNTPDSLYLKEQVDQLKRKVNLLEEKLSKVISLLPSEQFPNESMHSTGDM